jgi:thioester reductase-like protein
MRILFTGGHGFVGRYILRALLRRCPTAEISLLARGGARGNALDRVKRALRAVALPEDAVRVVEGDVDVPHFGLDDRRHGDLLGAVDRVVHAAANVRFDQDLPAARKANVEATARVLRFARQAGVERLDHISTCYVAGHRTDRVAETDLEHGAGFRNAYEQSKHEAELLLRGGDGGSGEGDRDPSDGGPAITVLRPSMVVGEAASGRTSSFHMIYWPMKLYARGAWRTMIGYPGTPVDTVPVDFVGEAAASLILDPAAAGLTYHLAAGADRQSTIGEIAAMTQRVIDGPAIRFVDPRFFMRWIRPFADPFLWLTPGGRRILKGGRLYLPYFAANPVFDTRQADAQLGPEGICPPPVTDYFERLVQYAVDTDFGRREGA